MRKQLADLSRKINADISPVFTSRKIKDEIKIKEDKPPLVNQQRIEEHKGSAIGNHLREQQDIEPEDIAQNFRILKCQNKFDCLLNTFHVEF